MVRKAEVSFYSSSSRAVGMCEISTASSRAIECHAGKDGLSEVQFSFGGLNPI